MNFPILAIDQRAAGLFPLRDNNLLKANNLNGTAKITGWAIVESDRGYYESLLSHSLGITWWEGYLNLSTCQFFSLENGGNFLCSVLWGMETIFFQNTKNSDQHLDFLCLLLPTCSLTTEFVSWSDIKLLDTWRWLPCYRPRSWKTGATESCERRIFGGCSCQKRATASSPFMVSCATCFCPTAKAKKGRKSSSVTERNSKLTLWVNWGHTTVFHWRWKSKVSFFFFPYTVFTVGIRNVSV